MDFKIIKYCYKKSMKVSPNLKALIFNELQEKMEKMEPKHSVFDSLKELCAYRGEKVLKETEVKLGKNEGNNSLLWSIEKVEFDQSILLWHIATDLCYYSDQNKEPLCIPGANCEASKVLSDYMLYLLVMCPLMLPNGIREIRFRDMGRGP